MRVCLVLMLFVVMSCNDREDVFGPLPSRATIFVRADSFDPDDQELAQGGEVTWRFPSSTPHSIIFETNPLAPDDEETMHSGNELITREFPNLGAFRFFCREHPEMKGTIRVR